MQWCILPITATPSSGSSSAIQICHSGRSRGSGVERIPSTIASRSSPSACSRCSAGSKAGIVDPHGLVEPERHGRELLAVARRALEPLGEVVAQRGEARVAGPSNVATQPTCIGEAALSTARNEASSADRRAALTASSPSSGCQWSCSSRAPSVVSQNSVSSAAKRYGSSSWGMWPAPAKTSKRLPGIASCAAAPCATGMIESRSPHTISVGSRAASASRSLALTRWPPGSITARTVCRNACREPALSSDAKPRARTPTSPLGCEADAAEQTADPAAEADQPAGGQRGEHVVGAGQRRGAQQQVDLAAEPAAGDQHQALGALGEQVGELHRDPAAERVPDDRHALVAERVRDVARPAGVRAERVVAARRGRLRRGRAGPARSA